MASILEVLSDIPEVVAIIFWPDYTPTEWEALGFWRLALAFTMGTVFGMAWLAFSFLILNFLKTIGI